MDEKHIAYIFNVFGCGKKEKTVKSELEDQKHDEILNSEDNEDTFNEWLYFYFYYVIIFLFIS